MAEDIANSGEGVVKLTPEALINLAYLASGRVALEYIPPGYFIAADGTPGIDVASDTFQSLLHAGE